MPIWFYKTIGFLFFGLGFVGIFLPILPTVPFWILAAIGFLKSDPKLAQKIFDHKTYGKMVEDFVKNGTLSPKAKRGALIGLFFSALIGSALTYKMPYLFAAQIIGIGLGAVFVATRPVSKD